MLEQLADSGLTGAPQFIEWIAIGVGLALATFIGRLNMARGKNALPAAPAMGEIAGAIIDKESADQIITASRRQTEAVRANTRAVEALVARLEDNTDAAKGAGAMIEEARKDIRELTRELIVRGR